MLQGKWRTTAVIFIILLGSCADHACAKCVAVRNFMPRSIGRRLQRSKSLSIERRLTNIKVNADSNLKDPKRKFFLNAPAVFKPFIGEGYRTTLMTELQKGRMWGFEQSQELGALAVNIRSTVVKLSSGDLWVHAPLFPTEEYVEMLTSLESPIKHIVLPTYALEHKLPIGGFVKKITERTGIKPKVWAVGHTWSFPIDLPLSWLGIPIDGIIGESEIPWESEIEFEILKIDDVGNPFVEAVFFDKKSKSLVLTDLVYSIPTDPPEVISPSLLLEVAPDDPNKPLPDSPKTRKQAWAKMALLIAFFIPARQRIVDGGKAEWAPGYMESFQAISGGLLVSPILRKLVFEKASPVVKEWVEKVTRWPFECIIPAHYAAPVKSSPGQFRKAFAFAIPGEEARVLPKEDMRTLDDLGEIIKAVGSSDGSDVVYGKLFDKFFKNLFVEKRGWEKERDDSR